MKEYQRLTHGFAPVYDERSRVLVLGSFPSVKSREASFYYGNPQNRFWRVTAECFGCPVPQSIEQKREMLLFNRVALWDVVQSCDILGSGDSSIRNAAPNDIGRILALAPIARIIANGATAGRLYSRFFGADERLAVLPSTSPANAAFALERLTGIWRAALCVAPGGGDMVK